MKRLERIEIRMTDYWKSRLVAEAQCLGLSLNAYIKLILANRKHCRKAFTEQEVLASER